MAASGATVVVGLNGALQKRFVLPPTDRLVPGNVHRAAVLDTGVGGKGQDVAVTLSCLQFSGNLQLAQFVGTGAAGDLVYHLLEELLGEPAMQSTVRTESGMRTCTSIVATDSTTELVEPSGSISSDELQQLLDCLAAGVGGASAVCIMGSMPPGCPDDTYAQIYKTVATPKTLCLIDSVAGLKPLLEQIASSKGSSSKSCTMLKINASELCRLAGVDPNASETSGVPVTQIVEAVSQFLAQNHPHAAKALNAIAITDGSHNAHLAALPADDDDELRLFKLPVSALSVAGDDDTDETSLSASTLYPIGAGDSVAAGTLAAWKFLTDRGDSEPCLPVDAQRALQDNKSPSTRAMLASFAFGLACGTASCLQEQNSVLKLQHVMELYNKEGRPVFLSSHKMPTSSSSQLA